MLSQSFLASWPTHDLVIALFALTAALLILAEMLKPRRIARWAVLLAFPSILAADYFLLSDVPRMNLPTAKYRGLIKKKSKPTCHYASTAEEAEAWCNDEEQDAAEADDDGRSDDGPVERMRRLFTVAESPTPTGVPQPLAGSRMSDCADCPELVVLPAATTWIGADVTDPHATPAEAPKRPMRIWPGFAISRAEITNADLARFRTSMRRPEPTCGGVRQAADAPATCVSWYEAKEYAAYLSHRTGKRYRLPSAAEWEYAANVSRASGQQLAASGDTRNDGPRDEVPRLVGFGGGVAEMTADCWSDLLALGGETSRPYEPAAGCETRVLKDGGDDEQARWRHPAARRPLTSDTRSPSIGFRIVRELD